MAVVFIDLDGTLCEHPAGSFNPFVIGKPVPRMVKIAQFHIELGDEVWIHTARAGRQDLHTIFEGTFEEYIEKLSEVVGDWTLEHVGKRLPVTAEKSYRATIFYDDRAVSVERNTGRTRSWLGMFE